MYLYYSVLQVALTQQCHIKSESELKTLSKLSTNYPKMNCQGRLRKWSKEGNVYQSAGNVKLYYHANKISPRAEGREGGRQRCLDGSPGRPSSMLDGAEQRTCAELADSDPLRSLARSLRPRRGDTDSFASGVLETHLTTRCLQGQHSGPRTGEKLDRTPNGRHQTDTKRERGTSPLHRLCARPPIKSPSGPASPASDAP